MSKQTPNAVSSDLQTKLNELAAVMDDRKEEFVDLLNSEHPSISRRVEASYSQCIWWEGCYYCRDDNGSWQRVKCFM